MKFLFTNKITEAIQKFVSHDMKVVKEDDCIVCTLVNSNTGFKTSKICKEKVIGNIHWYITESGTSYIFTDTQFSRVQILYLYYREQRLDGEVFIAFPTEPNGSIDCKVQHKSFGCGAAPVELKKVVSTYLSNENVLCMEFEDGNKIAICL